MRKASLALLAVAVFGTGLMFSELPQSASKPSNPEFVPGQRVLIKAGSWTIEATVAEPQKVNRAAKGDRLVSANGEPMEEHLFHIAERR